MKPFCVILIVFIGFACTQQESNNKSIRGVVVSSISGEPLPGVEILDPDTRIFTRSDRNGCYEIYLPQQSHSLEFRFLGMRVELIDIENSEVQFRIVELTPVIIKGPEFIVVHDTLSKRNIVFQTIGNDTVYRYAQPSFY
jgi:hypothetical protein